MDSYGRFLCWVFLLKHFLNGDFVVTFMNLWWFHPIETLTLRSKHWSCLSQGSFTSAPAADANVEQASISRQSIPDMIDIGVQSPEIICSVDVAKPLMKPRFQSQTDVTEYFSAKTQREADGNLFNEKINGKITGCFN